METQTQAEICTNAKTLSGLLKDSTAIGQMKLLTKYDKEFTIGENEIPEIRLSIVSENNGSAVRVIGREQTTMLLAGCDVNRGNAHTVVSAELLAKTIKVLGSDSRLYISKEPNNPVLVFSETLGAGIVIAPTIEE